jgi:hypothetical protein
VAALVGGLLARSSARPAHAGDGDPVLLGFPNFAASPTRLLATMSKGLTALEVQNPGFPPLTASDKTIAVFAENVAPPTDGVELSAGLVARGGAGAGTANGGIGLAPSGGNSDQGFAGTALIAAGGHSDQDAGGVGASFRGGTSDAQVGGVGLRAIGGTSIHGPGARSGDGIIATGGRSITGQGGDGLVAIGGNAAGESPMVGQSVGVLAYGGTARSERRAASGQSAPGLIGVGGGPEGYGATGVLSHGSAVDQGSFATFPGLHGKNAGAGPGLAGLCTSDTPQVDGAIAAVHGMSVNAAGGRFTGSKAPGLAGSSPDLGVVALSTAESGLTGVSKTAAGITAQSESGRGCEAYSTSSFGAYFETHSAGAAALMLVNSAAVSVGSGAGGLFLNGSWVVQNGLKLAAVKTSRGMTRLYCLEATVALFEDLGVVRLVNGRARVDLDPLFAEAIETGSYHVFLTPRGETGGVYVAAQDPGGFEVRAVQTAPGTVDVDYRVVAQRKGLPPGHRLATFQPPPPVPPPNPRWIRRPEPPLIPSSSMPPRLARPARPPAPPVGQHSAHPLIGG